MYISNPRSRYLLRAMHPMRPLLMNCCRVEAWDKFLTQGQCQHLQFHMDLVTIILKKQDCNHLNSLQRPAIPLGLSMFAEDLLNRLISMSYQSPRLGKIQGVPDTLLVLVQRMDQSVKFVQITNLLRLVDKHIYGNAWRRDRESRLVCYFILFGFEIGNVEMWESWEIHRLHYWSMIIYVFEWTRFAISLMELGCFSSHIQMYIDYLCSSTRTKILCSQFFMFFHSANLESSLLWSGRNSSKSSSAGDTRSRAMSSCCISRGVCALISA